MKNLIYLTILIIFFGCTDRNDSTRFFNFRIENNSGKNITITSYDSGEPTVIKKIININNNSFYFKSFESRASDAGYLLEDVVEGDSLVIDYEGDRKEIFTCINRFNEATGCNEPRNILNYFDANSDGNNSNTTYTFVVDDYNNAND